jgi:hypothetical protein
MQSIAICKHLLQGTYMARTAAIGIRVEPRIKEAAERAAQKDRRTVASLMEKILVDWLVANGHLPQDAAE